MDKRLLRVEFDHPQPRVKRGRIGFTVKGDAFIDGTLAFTWVNPVTKVLQVLANSESPDFQESNVGAFRKLQRSDVTTIDSNTPTSEFKMMAADGMHADSAIKYTGDNKTGIGVITTAVQSKNQGFTTLAYAWGKSTETDGVLIEQFWADDQNLTGGGVGIKVSLNGAVEIYKDGNAEANRVFRGSLSGSGYEPGSVRGASYERASDTFVMIRVEVTRKRFITITSSKGGVCNFECPWALGESPQPVLPQKRWGWYQPKGGGVVVAAPVVYASGGPYAISEVIQLSEAPGTGQTLKARTLAADTNVAVSLLAEDGVGPFDPTQSKCRVKLLFNQPAFVQGVTGYFPPIMGTWPNETIDVSEWLVEPPSIRHEDDGWGLGADLTLRGDAPVPFLTEAEGRPVRIVYTPGPGDGGTEMVILDGVAGAPEWVDGLTPEQTKVRIKVQDRLSLAKEAFVTEPTPFDGLPVSKPYNGSEGAPFFGDSIARICAQEAGFTDAEMDLADLDFSIEETPPQKAGDWNFATSIGDRYSDVLERAMGTVPEALFGVRPRLGGAKFFVKDPSDADPVVATFYRTPEEAEGDPAYAENHLGGFPLLYGDHERTRLPREGNLVRVTGFNPASAKGIQSYISDDDSRDPASALGEGKLGFTRTIAYADPALTTEAMVDRVAEGLYKATAQKVTAERWRAFLRFAADGSPVWRGDRVTLVGSNPDGSDATIRVSAFSFDPGDESGEGLAGEAAVSVRLADYCGGALLNLGGSSLAEIRARRSAQISYGEIRKRGYGRIPSTSMTVVKKLPAP